MFPIQNENLKEMDKLKVTKGKGKVYPKTCHEGTEGE
jgi:hypothetical protein